VYGCLGQTPAKAATTRMAGVAAKSSFMTISRGIKTNHPSHVMSGALQLIGCIQLEQEASWIRSALKREALFAKY
jgi:hypothetical protein